MTRECSTRAIRVAGGRGDQLRRPRLAGGSLPCRAVPSGGHGAIGRPGSGGAAPAEDPPRGGAAPSGRTGRPWRLFPNRMLRGLLGPGRGLTGVRVSAKRTASAMGQKAHGTPVHMARSETRQTYDYLRTAVVHATGMTTQPHLAIVGRSSMGLPRTYRLDRSTTNSAHPARSAAYRRLATAILGLDVSSLAAELRSARLLGANLKLAA